MRYHREMWKPVLSKTFSSKLRGFSQGRRDDIWKAVKRILVDPTINEYHRDYLKPFKQEHPSDKTLTIFFAVPKKPADRVFFVWVNDDKYPHDTRANHEDPCRKEFLRLKRDKELEDYDEDYHEGKFIVRPRPNAPTFLKFDKYGASVYANVLDDGVIRYVMAVASSNRPNDLFDHYSLFFEKIREHFSQHRLQFEFRAMDGDVNFFDILDKNLNMAHWRKTAAGGMTIFTMI